MGKHREHTLSAMKWSSGDMNVGLRRQRGLQADPIKKSCNALPRSSLAFDDSTQSISYIMTRFKFLRRTAISKCNPTRLFRWGFGGVFPSPASSLETSTTPRSRTRRANWMHSPESASNSLLLRHSLDCVLKPDSTAQLGKPEDYKTLHIDIASSSISQPAFSSSQPTWSP